MTFSAFLIQTNTQRLNFCGDVYIKFSIALKQTCSNLDIFTFAIDQTRSFLQASWMDFCVLQMAIWWAD